MCRSGVREFSVNIGEKEDAKFLIRTDQILKEEELSNSLWQLFDHICSGL